MNMIIMIALFMIVINLVSNAAVSFSSGGIISSIALSIILFGNFFVTELYKNRIRIAFFEGKRLSQNES